MNLTWTPEAWEEYLHWQSMDKKTLRRINDLIKDIMRSPFSGIGDPEALRHNLSGFWSRRINLEHRLVYEVQKEQITIVQCRFHY